MLALTRTGTFYYTEMVPPFRPSVLPSVLPSFLPSFLWSSVLSLHVSGFICKAPPVICFIFRFHLRFLDYPVSEASREIAARQTRSKQAVPHYYISVDVEVS